MPYVGKPIAWLQSGAWLPLGGWLALTIGAFLLASRKVIRRDDALEVPASATPRRTRKSGVRSASPTRRPLAAGMARLTTAVAPVVTSRALLGAAALAVTLASLTVIAVTSVPTSASFTARTRNGSSSWTVASATHLPYLDSVLKDDPQFMWLLDEPNGPVAADYTGHGRTGTTTGVDFGRQGAMPNNPGTAG